MILALLPRGVARHERVLVIALDGVRLGEIEERARRGAMPRFAALLDSGVVRSLDAAGLDPDAYWETIFAGRNADARRAAPAPRFWDALATGDALVLVHVPGVRSSDYPGATVLAGADEARGFVGDNVGMVANFQHLSRADVDWPYAAAAAEVAEVVAGLEVGASSDWIDVVQPGDDGRAGRFRLYRLDENVVYATPVYRVIEPAAPWDASGYVADDPSWATTSSRLGDYYFEHVAELAESRAVAAAELAGRDWHLMVYFDATLASVVRAATLVGEPEGAAVEAAYRALDARVAAIVDAVRPSTAVVVVGGGPGLDVSAAEADSGGHAGFFLLTPGTGRDDGPVERIESVEATLRYLAGLPPSPSQGEPIRAVQARFWRPSTPRLAAAPAAHGAELPFTVESFERLGLLSDSAPAPGPAEESRGSDASVASGR